MAYLFYEAETREIKKNYCIWRCKQR